MIIQRLKHSNDIILIELSEDTQRLISFIWGILKQFKKSNH